MQCLTPLNMSQLKESLGKLTDNSRIISGGTDFVIEQRAKGLEPDIILYPGGVSALSDITLLKDRVVIGSMATMKQINKALSPHPCFRAVADAAKGVGSPQIRAKATMAGNVCNGSPAGDSLPVSLLYDGIFNIMDPAGFSFSVPAGEFFLGPKKTVLKPGQYLYSIELFSDDNWISAFKKIGSRDYVSIARIGLGMRVCLDGEGLVNKALITLGAVANTPIRVPKAEDAMKGQSLFDEALFDKVHEIISQTVHDNCRPKNRFYKTMSSKGLVEDVFNLLKDRSKTPE